MPQPERERRQPDYKAYLQAYDVARRRYLDRPTPRNLALLNVGEAVLSRELLKPGRFELGTQVMTPGAHEAMELAFQIPPEFLLRHRHADWGDLDAEDTQANEEALRFGSRLFSAYTTRAGDTLWVITEWNRSATTLLLPEEY